MPFYYQIDSSNEAGRRTAERLVALRERLAVEVPPRTLNDTLLLGTWNIREFDSAAYGARLDESFYYIAEIISHFDLVAVQEVREELDALKRLNSILGGFWKYIVTDVTEGTPGNRERLAYLYDSRKVRFNGLAGEVVIPPKEIKNKKGKTIRYEPSDQLYRTPFLVGFNAGWAKFMLCTVHILYGEDTADNPKRVQEIKLVADFLAERADRESAGRNNLVLLGDFNIYGRGDKTMAAITNAGFTVPEVLRDVPATNVGKEKRHYDQMAFKVRAHRLKALSAGVFDFYNVVFTDDDQQLYVRDMQPAYDVTSKGKKRNAAGKRTYYRTYWRTHQMSDHLLMWVELGIDFGEEYLRAKAQGD